MRPVTPDTAPSLEATRRALEDVSRHARLLIETANDAVVTIGEDSLVMDWNGTAERMFGFPRAEALGRPLTDLIVPHRHREAHYTGLQRYLATGQSKMMNRRVETSAMHRDGHEFPVELSIWPVPMDAGHIFSAFIRDISDRRAAERALRESEEKYRIVVENANEGIVVSQDGMLKYANPRALALTDRTLDNALTTPFIEMVHPEDRARVYNNYVRRMRGEPVEPSYRFRAITPSGIVRWLQINAVAISWDSRPATLNFLADVTEEVALEADLAETLRQREAILQTTAVGIMFIQQGRIRWINSALERSMLGWEEGETLGKTGEIAFGDHGDWSRFLALCIPALERDGRYEGDWEVRRKDGSPWWCHMSAKALDARNLGAGTIWFFLDISARKRAEEETRRALERERELSELKTRFVSLTSHEFRTPLAAILSSLELLEDFGAELPAPERKELIRLAKAAVAKMAGMIDQVMLIGRAESDQLAFRPQPVAIAGWAERLVEETLHATGGRCPIEFRTSGAAATRLVDTNLLGHALGNLLDNAVKYSPAGSPVAFTVAESEEAVAFEVSDSGVGIPAEDQPRLFESFHRGRNVGNIEGTGLGLAIVKQCVELHGGSIAFESEPGAGTRFHVCVPAPVA